LKYPQTLVDKTKKFPRNEIRDANEANGRVPARSFRTNGRRGRGLPDGRKQKRSEDFPSKKINETSKDDKNTTAI
jgi:hypothetical protein